MHDNTTHNADNKSFSDKRRIVATINFTSNLTGNSPQSPAGLSISCHR